MGTQMPDGPTAAVTARAAEVASGAGMFQDGIYVAKFAGAIYEAQAVLVLRNGKIAGIGHLGGQYDGSIELDPERNVYRFEMVGTFPPNIALSTGRRIGPDGETLRFGGEVTGNAPVVRCSIDLAGRAVDVAVRFIRPLPG